MTSLVRNFLKSLIADLINLEGTARTIKLGLLIVSFKESVTVICEEIFALS